MKEKIFLVLKGFVMGIANIIPGVSGGTLAITLGIYEDLIKAISHFFSNIKENLKLLIPIFIGMVFSLAILSNVIGYSLEHYPIPTTLFFVGLILGGLPLLVKHIKGKEKSISNWIVFLITFLIVAVFAFLKSGNAMVDLSNLSIGGYLLLFIVGVVAAATMVIPGISGSFVLMLLGYYEPIINIIREFTKFKNFTSNFIILAVFGIGVLLGIIVIAKIIEYLLEKQPIKTYYGIIGFVLASIISIILPLLELNFVISQVVIGIILLLIGMVIAYKLGEE